MRITKTVDPAVLRATAEAEIDAAAERVRGLFITSGSGQSMAYAEKRREAEAFVADPSQDPAGFPHIAAEAAAFGTSPFDTAVEVLTMAELWRSASAMIETRRLVAKETVRTAATAKAIREAAEVDWSDIISHHESMS